MNLDLLKSTSNLKITFLSDINHCIDIQKQGRFKFYINFNFDIKLIQDFIDQLDEHEIYLMIPLISKFAKDNDPHIILSKQILVTKYSNYITINKFLMDQLDLCLEDYNFDKIDNFFLIFKYKKVKIKIN